MKIKHIFIPVAIVAFIVLIIVKRNESEKRTEQLKEKRELVEAKIKAIHCTPWKDVDKKSKLLNYIIDNSGYDLLPSEDLSFKVPRLIRQAAKYPSTVQYEGENLDSWILVNKKNAYQVDSLKGTWEYRFPFTAENKLSMRVKQVLVLKMKYNAGCEPAKIIDIKVS